MNESNKVSRAIYVVPDICAWNVHDAGFILDGMHYAGSNRQL